MFKKYQIIQRIHHLWDKILYVNSYSLCVPAWLFKRFRPYIISEIRAFPVRDTSELQQPWYSVHSDYQSTAQLYKTGNFSFKKIYSSRLIDSNKERKYLVSEPFHTTYFSGNQMIRGVEWFTQSFYHSITNRRDPGENRSAPVFCKCLNCIFSYLQSWKAHFLHCFTC